MEKIYGMQKLVGLQLFWSRTPTFSSGTPTFCQMGVLNSCFQNPSESSACDHSSSFISDWIFFIFAGNENNHKVLNGFKIQQDPTRDL